jgi:hypothetical protein
MHQSIQNCVGHGGVVNQLVPLTDWKLAGDQRGALAVAVIQDLQQVAVLLAGGSLKAPAKMQKTPCIAGNACFTKLTPKTTPARLKS